MTTLDIRLFGAIEIRRDGRMLGDFRSQKALVLLAYLVCERRPVTREYLATLAWPDAGQTQALGLLRRTLHDLNQQLPGCLAIDRRTVCYTAHPGDSVDVDAFADLARREDPKALADAIELYRAPFLQGVYVDDAPELERWVLHTAEAWQRLAVEAFDRLIGHQIARLEYARALDCAHRLLALEPWREEVHRQTMMLLARTGQPGAALAHYRRCREVLMVELGVEPSYETNQLHARIAAMLHMPSRQLPASTTPFVGRTEEIAALAALLASVNTRLVTLTGPGGIGKTRLAVEVARTVGAEATRRFLHGVVFVSLSDVETHSQFIAALAETLRLAPQPQGAQAAQLLQYLHDKEMLLLLDNFEQLVQPECLGFLAELLREASEVKLMVTSRTRLGLQSEHLFAILGLSFPAPGAAALGQSEPAHYASVDLFVECVRRVCGHKQRTAEEMAAVAAICALVQGMPLAIELAASWTGTLSTTEVAAEIARNFDFLAADSYDLPPRQRSMRAVFSASWLRLPAPVQTVLKQLSVMRGAFAGEAALAVAGATSPMVAQLVGSSLVEQTPSQRLQMHELVRHFAAAKLSEEPDLLAQALARHSDFYLDHIVRRAPGLVGAGQSDLLAEIGQDLPNIRAAWLWAAEQNDSARIDSALDGFYRYFAIRGRFAEGIEVLAQAALRLEAVAPSPRCDVLARLRVRQGALCYELGHLGEAKALLEAGLDDLRRSNRPEEVAFCLNFLAGVAWWQGAEEVAQQFWHESLAISRAMGDHTDAVAALYSLAWYHATSNELSLARPLAEEGLVLARRIAHTHRMAHFLDQLGAIALGMGEFLASIDYYREAVSLFRRLDDRYGLALSLTGLGRSMYYAGGYPPATFMPLLEEAAAAGRETGSHFALIVCLGVLGQIAMWLGDAHTGERYGQELVDRSLRLQDPFLPLCRVLLGAAQRHLGNLGDARRQLLAASAEILATPNQANTAGQWAIIEWACLLCAECGQPGVATRRELVEARRSQALEMLVALLAEPRISGYYKGMAAQLAGELSAELPDDVTAAVRLRARTRDIRQMLRLITGEASVAGGV